MDWTFKNDIPIYTQLIEQMTCEIVSGRIQPGEKLQSVRDIASEANVNPNTVQRALSDLEREGLIYSVRTSGRYVTENIDIIKSKKLELEGQMIQSFFTQMEKLGCSGDEIDALLNAITG